MRKEFKSANLEYLNSLQPNEIINISKHNRINPFVSMVKRRLLDIQIILNIMAYYKKQEYVSKDNALAIYTELKIHSKDIYQEILDFESSYRNIIKTADKKVVKQTNDVRKTIVRNTSPKGKSYYFKRYSKIVKPKEQI